MSTDKNFAIAGVAGFIAPRHLKAIKDTGNRLVAAVDPHDSVGIMDSYFPDAAFFTQFERFDRHLEKLRRSESGAGIDYLTICSPNYLHDAHIRLALRVGADAICEKPLVLNPWNLDILQELEADYGKSIYTVLQLRVHPAMLELKKKQENAPSSGKPHIELSYITSRGQWYHYSWKGDVRKSGGIATNIGIHFFDLLIWLFGGVQAKELHLHRSDKMSGFLELENATVSWYLSIDRNDLPAQAKKDNKPTYRSITIDGKEIEFSGGFTDLHTRVYQHILEGAAHGIEAARPSIELVYSLRNMKEKTGDGLVHPLTTA